MPDNTSRLIDYSRRELYVRRDIGCASLILLNAFDLDKRYPSIFVHQCNGIAHLRNDGAPG